MLDFLQTNEAQLVLWIALGAVLLTAAVFIVKRFRDRSDDDQPKASDLLTNFRDLHSQGGLSDEEYRTIKAQLTAQLQNEIKDTERTG